MIEKPPICSKCDMYMTHGINGWKCNECGGGISFYECSSYCSSSLSGQTLKEEKEDLKLYGMNSTDETNNT